MDTRKCVDGDCLFLDETTGEYYYSSPDANDIPEMLILGIAISLFPVLMVCSFYLGGS